MLLALALTSILALAPQDSAEQTCREAYVEAWFQETAEADLEAALRSYRRCTELGETGQRGDVHAGRDDVARRADGRRTRTRSQR